MVMNHRDEQLIIESQIQAISNQYFYDNFYFSDPFLDATLFRIRTAKLMIFFLIKNVLTLVNADGR